MDGLDLHAKVAEHLDDMVLAGYLLLLVDVSAVVLILLQQVEGRVFVSGNGSFGLIGVLSDSVSFTVLRVACSLLAATAMSIPI